jgi:hypothetical protein
MLGFHFSPISEGNNMFKDAIKLIYSAVTLLSIVFVSETASANKAKTYRMKPGDIIRCMGAEGIIKVDFRGKGFNRIINRTTNLNCTMMEVTSRMRLK